MTSYEFGVILMILVVVFLGFALSLCVIFLGSRRTKIAAIQLIQTIGKTVTDCLNKK